MKLATGDSKYHQTTLRGFAVAARCLGWKETERLLREGLAKAQSELELAAWLYKATQNTPRFRAVPCPPRLFLRTLLIYTGAMLDLSLTPDEERNFKAWLEEQDNPSSRTRFRQKLKAERKDNRRWRKQIEERLGVLLAGSKNHTTP